MAIEVQSVCVLIQVFDMPTSIRFYCDKLGFALVEKSSDDDDYFWARLQLGGAEIMLNTAYESDERPEKPEATRIAAHQDTVFYFRCPDVDGIYRQLKEAGLEVPRPTIANYGMKQLYLTDPDGYQLCFQCPAE